MPATRAIWLANPSGVFTANNEDASGGVVVQGNQIVELVSSGQTPVHKIDEKIDLSGRVLLPGLINTHHHFYQTLTRAYPTALNTELFQWLKTLYPVWARLRPESIRCSTELALAELLLSGCTTASDHHYLFSEALSDAIDIQAEVAQAMGVRVVLTRGSMSLGQDQGGLPPVSVVQSEQQILEDSFRLIRDHHQRGPGAMTQIALAPCSPFSVTPDLMRETAALAKQTSVRLHTHLAETEDEESFCLKRFNLRPVDYLESVDWLGPQTWLAHGIHFSEDEIVRLGQHRVGIAHCPSSNMMLASGICRVNELEQAGCPVGLGVDGSASNDCSNMIQEARQAMYLQRLRYGSQAVSDRDALRWATLGSAKVLGREDIGELAVGKMADLAIFALTEEPRFSGAHDPLAALLLCGAHRAEAVMINGEWRVRNGELVDLDLAEIMERHKEAALRLVH